MITRLLNTIFFILIAMAMQGQQYNKKDFKVYLVKDGLSNNNTLTITQDAYGYIWIGTVKGLNRFNGSSFKQFYSDSFPESLPEDRVFNLKWINNEELGVLTSMGLHIINTRTLQKRNMFIPPDSTRDFKTVNRIFDIKTDKKGNLFIITVGGFYHFNQDRLIFRYDHYGKSRSFGWEIVQANANTLLLSTQQGLYIYNIEKKDLHSAGKQDDSFLQQISLPKKTFRLTYDDESFFALEYGGTDSLVLFDLQKRTTQPISPHVPTSSRLDFFGRIFRLNDTVLAATGAKGFHILHMDKQTRSWSLDTTLYFPNDFCNALLVDKNNRLWISTANGLYKQNRPGERVELTQLPGEDFTLQKTITGLTIASNKVFIGTIADGLYVLNQDSLSLSEHIMYPAGQTFITELIKINEDSVISSGSGFLINTRNLLYKKIDPNKAPLGTDIKIMLKDSHNRIYFSKSNTDSLYFKDPWDKSFSAVRIPELQKILPLTQMDEDNEGNIWLGGNGLMRLNKLTKKIDLHLDSFPFIKRQQKEIISNIAFDRSNSMYFGIRNSGLMIYNVKEKKIVHFTRDHGLPDNSITAVYLHENTTLWIATETGFANYDLNSKKISSFGASDGMPNGHSVSAAFYYDSLHQQLYATLTPTILRFDPIKLKKNQTPPYFFIESIDITDKETLYHPDKVITVPYKNNSVIVNLAAINYEDASQQLFSYRLVKDGNEIWQEIGTQNRVFFNSLPAGKHKLQLKVYIRNQSWPDQIKEIIIIIKPPFWKTIWFYLLSFLLLAGVAYYLHRRRINFITQKANIDKQLAQTEMKALHSQMNPHFIFNCLNSIREMILNNENEQASLYLSKFARLIRITLDQSSKTFVTLEDTIDYLKRYLEMEQIRKSDFNYKFDIDKILQPGEIVLPPMLIQPLIENAIWHGAVPGKIMQLNIQFKREKDELICIVEDDGIGIETSLKNKESDLNYQSVGISNIKQRIHVLNEKYNLQSTIEIKDRSTLTGTNETGTIVTLHLPIKTNESLWTT